jgi:predicted DNA-binding protein YlxM (UPF0122 family)
MLDKLLLIKEYYVDKMTMQAIADRHHRSRQRIHQLLTSYKVAEPNKKNLALLSLPCNKCNKKSTVLHKVGNMYIQLCGKCHQKELKKTREANSIILICSVCGKEIKIEYAKDLKVTKIIKCRDCKEYEKRKRTKKTVRQFQREKSCIDCKNPFTKKNPYRSLNRCLRCYYIYIYNVNDKRKTYHRKYYQIYSKTYSKTPQYKAYQHEYGKRKWKEHILERNKQAYIEAHLI